MKYKIDAHAIGSLGEFSEWEVIYNMVHNFRSFDNTPCPHAVLVDQDKQLYYVPRTIRILTQCGHDCTDLCLDCVLDKYKE